MHTQDEFLWTGLRARLERTGKVRSHTIRPHQRPAWRRPEVRSDSAKPALRPEIRAVAQPARSGSSIVR